MTQIAQEYHISRTFLYQLILAANLQLETLFSDHKPHVENPHPLFEPLASKRSAETWQAHFDDLSEHPFHSIGMASDRSRGLMAGYHAACQDAHWVCDQFQNFLVPYCILILISSGLAALLTPLIRSLALHIGAVITQASGRFTKRLPPAWVGSVWCWRALSQSLLCWDSIRPSTNICVICHVSFP